ncbi:DUF2163 domain-containing protein [Lutibaculum baratangense]|uniref:FAD/FMN-containing dehydrogenase n=1 Tax=Lutibaculum baratangense AMV1 TaxID=631454 RepID=V4QSP9_9HYPH|nr:DUF2163 domain-containing protein [Lutibaculum baratangense]ESR22802.1 FAD/FMN-containing dehydrogenase [Lutibaculum baratangense AMV1]
MKTLSPELAAHLAGGVTTLCWCWKLTRTDGVTMGFTDHDRPVVFGGVSYEAESGFTASEVQSSLGLSVDNLDVAGALSSDRIEEGDIRGGLYDGADVEIWRVNWAAPEQRVLMRKGSIGEIRRSALAFTAEMRGLAHRLEQAQGRTFQRMCDADLGDGRCKAAVSAAAGTVLSSSDDRLLRCEGLAAFDGGRFRHGRLVWTSGANAGLQAEVRAHRAGTVAVLELWERTAHGVEPGDAFDVFPGCDKTMATCRDRFDNLMNFRGFPHMPGNDRAFGYVAGESGEHDGGSFFN